MQKRVQKANPTRYGSTPMGKVYEDEAVEIIIFFEHINVDGLHTWVKLVEVKHMLGVLKGMEAGVVSVNEHTLDTTHLQLMEDIKNI